MAFSYITPENLKERYEDSKTYTESLTDAFPEFERIARNRPKANIEKQYPKTTDGTTASVIRKTPRRVIQQLPTGVVKSDKNDWLTIVASFIYTHKILENANEDYALIQKSWSVVEKGLSFGATGTYCPFLERNGEFTTDLSIPYWADIFLQRGKKSGYACKYIFMRSWWQKSDLEAIIESQSKLPKDIEKTWDVKALQSILDQVTTKDEKSQTASEKEKKTDVSSGIELVTGFQTGVGAKFYTFHPKTNTIVRTKVNKDPRGLIPIDWFYGDTDGSNPLGRGIVELVGGLQNLIDSDMQMYQFNRALLLAPPLIKKGNFNKNKVKLIPNIVIDVGTDQNADVETLKIDSTAIANYPNLYGLQKSQLLNLLASPDTSISSDVGNPGFSKTPAGVKSMQANISVDDNYVRKMFETWFSNWSETAINLYFAERTGVEELQLDQETADKLRKLAEKGKFDLEMLTDDNVIMIDYDSATEALKFEVDASTSQKQDNSQQLEALDALLQRLEASPLLQQLIPQDKIVEAWNSIVAASGVEDPEKLTVDEEALQQHLVQQQQAQMEAQAQAAQQPNIMPDQPQPDQMPQDQPPQFSEEDQQLIAMLQQHGVSDNKIGQALAMLHHGMSEQDILQMIAEPEGAIA